jgi:ketosteroid isomerase-like protein
MADPVTVHEAVEAAFNSGDVDALVALYEPDAGLVRDDGSVASGLDEIRAEWSALIALGGQVTLVTRHAVEVGDLCLLSNDWTFRIDGEVAASARTSEVARRQPDGSWRYVIDAPYGGGDLG